MKRAYTRLVQYSVTMKNIFLVIGTRPEIIKVAPLIKEAHKAKIPLTVVHSGQHYSPNMDKVFWDNFKLSPPKHNLHIKAKTNSEQVGKMLAAFGDFFAKHRPDVVAVYADLNTTLAAALAANHLHIPIVHLEAGLRSFDLSMPEEVNRVLVGDFADYHLATGAEQVKNLKKERITKNVHIVGNVVVDSLALMLKRANRESAILEKLHLKRKSYILMTMHRQGGVDVRENLVRTLEAVGDAAARAKLPVIFPMHPRTKKRIEEFKVTIPNNFTCIEPLDYLDFLKLESNARLIISDSGGIQEEACILGVPLVTLRPTTERPETLRMGCNVLVGNDPKKIKDGVSRMLRKKTQWKHPYGVNVSKKIVKLLREKILA